MDITKYEFESPRKSIIDFLSQNANVQYFIPVFQRNYVWGDKQIKQYIDDLESIMNENDEKKQIHYLGTIIHKPNKIPNMPGKTSNQIVDGQQRLTTTFLILYALKNIINELGDKEFSKGIVDSVLTNAGSPDPYKLKLKPSIAQDDTYRKIALDRVNDITGEEKDSAVYSNYKKIKDEIEKRTNKKIDEVKKFYNALENFYIVPIELNKNEDIQKIFESINATGKELSQSDLIRNFVMMQLSNNKEQEELYDNYWRQIEKNTKNDEDKTAGFFRQFIAIKEYALKSRRNIYDSFKEWYNKEIKNKTLDDIMKELKTYSDIYYKLLYDEKSNNIEQVALFRRVSSDMPLSLIMYIGKQYWDDKLINDKVFNNCLKVINTYLIRRGICNIPTNSISSTFPTILKNHSIEVFEKTDKVDPEQVLIKLLIVSNRNNKKFLPDDEKVRNDLTNEDLYNDTKRKSCLNIFFKHYESINNGVIPKYLEDTSIEHIMPQNGKKWVNSGGWLNIEEYNMYNYRLGNLTLLYGTDNQKAKHNIFDKKKDIFKSTSNYKLNIDIINKQSWGKKEIIERTEKLVNEFIKFYPDYNNYNNIVDDDQEFIDIRINSESSNNVCMVDAIFDVINGNVTIKEGSYFTKRKYWYDNSCEELFNNLIEEGVLKENNEKIVFETDYDFISEKESNTALSPSALFVLNYSVNGKDKWKDLNDNPIKDNEIFKKSKYGS